MKDRITQSGLRKRLPCDVEAEVFDRIDSTNTVARERMAQGCRQWHTVIARCQTGGEGRLGRSFFSPDETGLYMSCVLYPKREDIGLITGTAAVAVCEAVEDVTGVKAKIKWVNDIFVDGKKVCGILAKSVFLGESAGVILGIGINVYRPVGGFPEYIKKTAGYLAEEKREGLCEELCEGILRRLRERYDAIGEDDAQERYRERCLTVGREVTVEPLSDTQRSRPAYALRVENNYNLTVRYENGDEETLSSGEVSVKL
ncbi:MAG: biotin--[acetyl-CoA-carboxylase] ligase [Ruminococcaceae bacterium]|nr:biotin--[acetyl-CoA-carboxylase] ligase [Oscillospiraceae bacterium]